MKAFVVSCDPTGAHLLFYVRTPGFANAHPGLITFPPTGGITHDPISCLQHILDVLYEYSCGLCMVIPARLVPLRYVADVTLIMCHSIGRGNGVRLVYLRLREAFGVRKSSCAFLWTTKLEVLFDIKGVYSKINFLKMFILHVLNPRQSARGLAHS